MGNSMEKRKQDVIDNLVQRDKLIMDYDDTLPLTSDQFMRGYIVGAFVDYDKPAHWMDEIIKEVKAKSGGYCIKNEN